MGIVSCLSEALVTVALLLNGQFHGFRSAVLWKDQLFVSIPSRATRTSNLYHMLYRGTLAQDRRAVVPPQRYELLGVVLTRSQYVQLKIDIRDNRLLVGGPQFGLAVYPLVDLQLLEASVFAETLCEVRGYRNSSHFVDSCYAVGDLLFPEHRAPDVLLPAGNYPGDRAPWRAYHLTARWDTQLHGGQSIRLFHAHKDKLFVSVEPLYLRGWLQSRKEPNEKLPKPPERELRTGKLPADFTERFAAYTAEKRDYLVTPNGKVYTSVPKGKAEVEVTKVWDDPKQRIVGVVQDQANDAVYGWGFVTDSAAPERFYVKLAPTPVAVPYKRTVPLWGDRSDAYLESYECARAFRKDAEKK